MNLKSLYTISYGLYVIGARNGGKLNGQIANTVIQVCSEPPIISVCINKGNLTHELIKNGGLFTVSVLSQDAPLNFIGNFGFKSGRDINKFEGVNYKTGESKAPIVLDHTLAYMEAKVTQRVDAATHTVFLGELVGADVIKEGTPMTYAYYRQIKGGTTPRTAPSYVEEKKGGNMKAAKYVCSVCGYIYDPEKGDPDSGIAPGTPFEKIPKDWVCPICGASKADFTKE